ncbi:MAG TPA: radical SAM protein [Candidatus Nanoarchaeia archaeon]|nr:radical SAM protein [Candidatus Nanoarchaeia archaeon]
MMLINPDSKRSNPFRKVYDDELFKNILENKDKLPKFPFLVDIELTNFCNLKCLFCGQQAMRREKGFMSEEVFRKVIDECAQHNAPVRFIRWGEPFLHEKIIEFGSYAKSKNVPVHITNNGQAIRESDMAGIIEHEFDSIIFSFQGATKAQYEVMRNNNNYDKLKANILRLVELRGDKPKPFIHVSSTMTNDSKEEIESFVNYWRHIVDSVGIGKTNLSLLTASQIKSLEVVGKIEVLKQQETVKKEYRPCTEVYQKLSVNWDGKVTCCCGDYDNFLIVGDLAKNTLYEIWNSSRELKTFRDMLDKMMHKSLTLCSVCYHAYEDF